MASTSLCHLSLSATPLPMGGMKHHTALIHPHSTLVRSSPHPSSSAVLLASNAATVSVLITPLQPPTLPSRICPAFTYAPVAAASLSRWSASCSWAVPYLFRWVAYASRGDTLPGGRTPRLCALPMTQRPVYFKALRPVIALSLSLSLSGVAPGILGIYVYPPGVSSVPPPVAAGSCTRVH